MKSLYNSKNLALYAGSISGTFSTSKLYNLALIMKRCTDIKKSNLVLVTNSVPYDGSQDYSMTFSLELGTQNYELYEFEGSISLVKGTNYITRELGLKTYIGSAESAVSGNVYGYAWQQNYGTYGQLKIDGYTDVELPTSYAKIEFEGTFKVPTIGNITCNQLNVRNPITVNWDVDIQDICEIAVKQNGNVVYTTTGTTAKSITIPAGILSIGEFTVDVIVANNPYSNLGASATKSQSFTAVSTAPVITSLEPDGINQNVDLQINVSWVCSNQDTYTLKAYQDNVLLKTYSGTTQKSLVIPAGTFKAGNIKLELQCSNTVNGVVATATRTATFIGYGRPPAPILDQQTIYNRAKPTFKWESADQVAYILEIWKDNVKIEGTAEVIGTDKTYTTQTALSNNTKFIVKVKVKNQFNLWSDFANKEITVSYTELPKPTFDIVREGSGILITMTMPETQGLASLEIWRKDAYSNWVRLAYDMKRTDQWTDNTVASGKEYFYKVIANALNGGMSESDIKTEKAEVKDFVFVDIEDTSKKIVLRWNPKVSISNRRKISSKIYAGCSKPKIEKGKVKYKVASMEFTVEKPELEHLQYLADTSQVILFRDRRGEKIYGQISSDIGETYEMMDRVNISFEFTELNFIERDIHKGSGGIVLTFFNGAWKFDGSIDFSGYGVL